MGADHVEGEEGDAGAGVPWLHSARRGSLSCCRDWATPPAWPTATAEWVSHGHRARGAWMQVIGLPQAGTEPPLHLHSSRCLREPIFLEEGGHAAKRPGACPPLTQLPWDGVCCGHGSVGCPAAPVASAPPCPWQPLPQCDNQKCLRVSPWVPWGCRRTPHPHREP